MALLRKAGTYFHIEGPRLRGAPLRAARVREDKRYASSVLPLLITVTLRDFTLASNETTLPSFHNSIVTVSPGTPGTRTARRGA